MVPMNTADSGGGGVLPPIAFLYTHWAPPSLPPCPFGHHLHRRDSLQRVGCSGRRRQLPINASAPARRSRRTDRASRLCSASALSPGSPLWTMRWRSVHGPRRDAIRVPRLHRFRGRRGPGTCRVATSSPVLQGPRVREPLFFLGQVRGRGREWRRRTRSSDRLPRTRPLPPYGSGGAFPTCGDWPQRFNAGGSRLAGRREVLRSAQLYDGRQHRTGQVNSLVRVGDPREQEKDTARFSLTPMSRSVE